MITFTTKRFIQHGSVIHPIFLKMKAEGYEVQEDSIFTKAKKIVTSTIHSPILGRAVFYQHGLGFHEHWKWSRLQCFARLFPGEFWTINQGPGPEGPSLKRPERIVGWAKSDLLFSPNLDGIRRKTEEEILFKKPFERTVLMAARGVWEGISSEVMEHLIRATAKVSMNLIIKFHDRDNVDYTRKNLFNMDHVTLVSKTFPDITRLFPSADITFGAGSSVEWEFPVTGKPSVSLLPSSDSYSCPFGILRVEPKQKPIEDLLSRFLIDSTLGSTELEQWKENDIIYSPDGHATDRAIEFILEAFGEK